MNTSPEYLIETQGLSKTYKGVNALQSLDLWVRKNTICGFLYSLTIQGDVTAAQQRISQQLWVSAVRVLASNGSTSLQSVARRSFWSGFGNLLRNENMRNWSGRRWIMPAATSLVIINGLVLLLALAGRSDPNITIEETAAMANSVFFQIGMLVTALAIIIRTQGVIIGEKQLGTAAWVLSKPASRSAFVLTKWLAFLISTLVLSLGIPAVVFSSTESAILE